MGRNHSKSKLKYIVTAAWVASLGVVAIVALQRTTNPARADDVFKSPYSNDDPRVVLGRALFFDSTLSNPAGQSCASCHSAGAGFTFPDSRTNERLGVAPGAVDGRFGNRLVPTISYVAYLPTGNPTYSPALTAFVGGVFWDGRAPDLLAQVHMPMENPNEMNNVRGGKADVSLIAEHLRNGPNADLFERVYGERALSAGSDTLLAEIATAIDHFEKSSEVSPFSSKYDAYLAGKATLTDDEMAGLRLATGSTTGRPGGPANYKFAQCALCHGIPSDPAQGPDLWTNTCYANIGVPRNRNNPYYKQTNRKTDPLGYNPQGENFVDLGLGDFIYPQLGLSSGNQGRGSNGKGDYLAIDGTFKAPTLRNVDLRPSDDFVKAYMHNGVFKSLKDVVHFYNTRNLTEAPGEVIDFTKANPYEDLEGKPLWPEPEFPSPITLQNPTGAPGSASAQVGNLGLTDEEENQIVAFLKTLSDGYFNP